MRLFVGSVFSVAIVASLGFTQKKELQFEGICDEPSSLTDTYKKLAPMRRLAIAQVASSRELSDLHDEFDLERYSMTDIRVKFDYYKVLAERVSAEQFSQVKDQFNKMQQSLLTTLENDKTERWSVEQRQAMIAKVSKVKLQAAEKFVADEVASRPYFFAWGPRGNLLSLYCYKDGLAPSAFYYPESDTVVVCPGALLEAFLVPGNRPEDLSFLFAHEVAHSIDPEEFSHELFDITSKFFRQGYDRPFWQEMGADEIGARGFARFVADASSDLDFVQGNLRRFCDLPASESSDGSDRYPSGRVRVELVLEQLNKHLQLASKNSK